MIGIGNDLTIGRRIGVRLSGGGGGFEGALDGITATWTGVYSLYRLLSSYTGNLVRLRRSSDNAEADFGAGADGVLDVAAVNTWLGADTPYIVTLYDQSGSSSPATQVTAAKQPTLVSSGILAAQFTYTSTTVFGELVTSTYGTVGSSSFGAYRDAAVGWSGAYCTLYGALKNFTTFNHVALPIASTNYALRHGGYADFTASNGGLTAGSMGISAARGFWQGNRVTTGLQNLGTDDVPFGIGNRNGNNLAGTIKATMVMFSSTTISDVDQAALHAISQALPVVGA